MAAVDSHRLTDRRVEGEVSGQSVSDTGHSGNPGTLLFLAREIQAPRLPVGQALVPTAPRPPGQPGQVDVEMEGCEPGAGRAAHSVRVWPPTGEASRGATGPPAPGRGSGLCSLILASSLVPGWPRVPLPCPRGHGLRSEAAALGSRAAGVGVAVTAECGRQTGRSGA